MCQPLFFTSAIIKAQRGTENKKKTKPLKTKNKMKKEITTMKKNAIIYIDDTHAQVTKAFEKQARIFGTPEYREWRAYRQDFPNAQMVPKTIKKAKNKKNDAKNRTYEKMAEYISLQENAAELMKEFEAQKKLSIVQKSPYRFVLNWFLDTFDLREDEDKEEGQEVEATAAEEAAPASETATNQDEAVEMGKAS